MQEGLRRPIGLLLPLSRCPLPAGPAARGRPAPPSAPQRPSITLRTDGTLTPAETQPRTSQMGIRTPAPDTFPDPYEEDSARPPLFLRAVLRICFLTTRINSGMLGGTRPGWYWGRSITRLAYPREERHRGSRVGG